MKNNPADGKATDEESPVRKLFSVLLIVSGGLITTTAGVCSIAALGSGLGSSMENLPLVLIVGGVPLVIGITLLKWGQSLRRSKNAAAVSSESSEPSSK